MSSYAADINNLLVTPSEHQRETSAGHQVGPSHVHVPGSPPNLRIAIDDWARSAKYASIVNQNIEAPKLVLNTRCRALAALLVRHVELNLQYSWRTFLRCHSSVLDVLFESCCVGAGSYGNAGSARFGEGEANGSANSFGSTADEDILAMEVSMATVNCFISIAVQGFGVVISCD